MRAVACRSTVQPVRHKPDTAHAQNRQRTLRKLSQAHAGDVAKTLGKDVDTVYASMKADGLQVRGGDETVEELARGSDRPPEAILTYFMK